VAAYVEQHPGEPQGRGLLPDRKALIRFREKGGKETEIPVHHKLEELLDRYLEKSGLRNRPNAPLFPIALGKTRKLGNRPATRIDAARML
jgi:site-specific recombinase XerC